VDYRLARNIGAGWQLEEGRAKADRCYIPAASLDHASKMVSDLNCKRRSIAIKTGATSTA
jgi:hypothetical protein